MKNNNGFTLVEILVGVLIFTIVILGGFYALNAINIGKLKLMQDVDITKDSYYFSEKLFNEIKNGGTIDFEEYFNRKVIGVESQSGHYLKPTGFGNFGYDGVLGTTNYGNGFYYCRSGNGVSMGTGGCYNNTFNTLGASTDTLPQRYGQYAFQFIDYNSNKNNDTDPSRCGPGFQLGDENCDGNIRGDDDDENLGLGPIVFTGGTDVKELYLISGNSQKRTLFRWIVTYDKNHPNYPDSNICNFTTLTGSGCFGTIEFLKLDGKDYGLNHSGSASSAGSFDGIIDTWFVNKDFTGGSEIVAGSNNTNYWQPIFPDTINVKSFKVYLYPNIDILNNWKDITPELNINPYVRLNITLAPSRKKIPAMRTTPPEINISTTINLSDYFN